MKQEKRKEIHKGSEPKQAVETANIFGSQMQKEEMD
jgi:hypothetical protein